MAGVIGYIKLGDVKGLADDANHKEWIELLSVHQNVSRNVSPTSKPKEQQTQSQVQFGAIVIQKKADVSSPELVLAAAQAKTFPEVTIDMVRQGEKGREVYYQIVMKDVFISDYSIMAADHGKDGGGAQNIETVSLVFNEVKWSYKQADTKGKQQAPKEAGWKVGENAPA
jgi:type VI secretion system secreted protein Hcp